MGIARWGVVVAKNDVRLVSAMPITSADPTAILTSGMLWSSGGTAYTLTEEIPFSGQRSEIPSIASVLGLNNPRVMVRYACTPFASYSVMLLAVLLPRSP